MKKLMRKAPWMSVFVVLWVFIVAVPAMADTVNNGSDVFSGTWTDGKSISGSTVMSGYGLWEGSTPANTVTMNWNVVYDLDTNLFSYTYTFTQPGTNPKNISHVILEVTNPALPGDFSSVSSNVSPVAPATWTSDGSNPNMPEGVYGIKFNNSGTSYAANPFIISFVTWREPVWGDIYVKDGNQGQAWNKGFTYATTADSSWYVARPDGSATVPVPAAVWLLGAGLIGLVGIRRRVVK